MESMSRVFIVNLKAGKRKALLSVPIIEEACKEAKVPYRFFYTDNKEEATEIVKNLPGNQIVYSVGGDGTLSGIVNGIVDTNHFLGVIPVGSGNDFYRSTVESLNPGIHHIDLGVVNRQYFINVASLGIDADVAKNVSLMKDKNVHPSIIYESSIVYSLLHRKDLELEINHSSSRYTMFTLCNGRYYGGGYKIGPTADLQDGLFDVYMVDPLKGYQIPLLLGKLRFGTHESSKHVHHSYTDFICISSSEKIPCNVDGEIIEDDHFKFSIRSEALKLYHQDDLGIQKVLSKTRL